MRRILVVDDEPHVTRLMQQKLESEGYAVRSACNGEDALSIMLNEAPFDAVVTDYNMPKMDGRELCEAIRKRFHGESIFIFLVTARLEAPLRTWAEELPRLQYIEKPLSLRDLIARLEQCFAKHDAESNDAEA